MKVIYEKYHALGNDYLVLDPAAGELPPEDAVRLICHRNFGLGSDGILYGPLDSESADYRLRIINPDGSEAEKSGNGLRIFCRYLHDQGKVAHKPFTIETLGGTVTCRVDDPLGSISVEMGKVSFDSGKIPVCGEQREVIEETLEIDGEKVVFCAATVGNPHCVIPVAKASAEMAHRLGPKIEIHSLFPHRTNVQFLEVVDRETIKIEIWERGAGYTLASGSSSSAAAAVAHRLGLVGQNIRVLMPGGELTISIDDEFGIVMVGPATRVGQMVLDHDDFN